MEIAPIHPIRPALGGGPLDDLIGRPETEGGLGTGHVRIGLSRRVGTRVEQDEAADHVGMTRCVLPSYRGAHRVSDESEAAEPDGFSHARDVCDQQSVGVAPGLIGESVAPLVEGKHVVPVGQSRRGSVPRDRVRRAAVQQQHRWIARVTPFDDVEVQASGSNHDLTPGFTGHRRQAYA